MDLPPFELKPVVLQGTHARLEPMNEDHAEGLYAAGGHDPELWRWMLRGPLADTEDALAYIREAIDCSTREGGLAFTAIDEATGRVAGSTRFLAVRPVHRGLEIGHTWLGPDFRRTAVNRQCKYLLLQHAFEHLGALRVEFKTDSRNERSQRAMERIGAKLEGTHRMHVVRPDGTIRDSVYYSILRDDYANCLNRLRLDLS